MKRRAVQIASEIEKAVSEVLARGLSDPRAQGLITVTGVEVLEDLSVARVTVSILPEEQEALTMHGLKSAAGFIRREAMKRIHVREMPILEFRVDTGLKNQAKVFALLNKIAEEREAKGGGEQGGGSEA